MGWCWFGERWQKECRFANDVLFAKLEEKRQMKVSFRVKKKDKLTKERDVKPTCWVDKVVVYRRKKLRARQKVGREKGRKGSGWQEEREEKKEE